MALDRYRLLAQLGRAPMASRIARRSRARADRSTRRSSNSATWAARGRTPRDGGNWLARLRLAARARASVGGPRARSRGWITTLLTWPSSGSAARRWPRPRARRGRSPRRRDGAGRFPGRRAGGGASPGPGPRPAGARPGLPRRRPVQARLHRHRRRLPGRVACVARRSMRIAAIRKPTPAAVRRPIARPTSTAWACCSSGC